MLEIIGNKEKEDGSMTEETVCIGLARVSSETQKIVSGTLKELKDIGKLIYFTFSPTMRRFNLGSTKVLERFPYPGLEKHRKFTFGPESYIESGPKLHFVT